VKAIIRVAGDEAEIDCAKDSEYGLSAAVWSRERARQGAIGRATGARLARGVAHRVRHVPSQRPNGTRRGADAVRWLQQSYGRFGGRAGIEAFTESPSHRAALDFAAAGAAALSVLIPP